MTDSDILKLLGRKERLQNTERISCLYKGKVVLVTGGGGSIGSEICKKLVKAKAKEVIALDFSEFNLWKLRDQVPSTRLRVVLGDCGDVFSFVNFRANVIIHAAAYKHVPFSEEFPEAFYRNNINAFSNVVRMAKTWKAKLILISTDKAVDPSCVMGKTKLLCETMNDCGHTVRFGNVLQSSGSVVPLFLDKIDKGKNLPVTDKRMTRFLISKAEAVSLVL